MKYIIILLLFSTIINAQTHKISTAYTVENMNLVREYIIKDTTVTVQGFIAYKYLTSGPILYVAMHKYDSDNNRILNQNQQLIYQSINKNEQRAYNKYELTKWLRDNWYSDYEITEILNTIQSIFE